LHRWRSHDSSVDPNGKENRVHSTLAHARNVDVAIRIALAKVKAFREKTLCGVVVGIQHYRGEMQFVSAIRNRIRSTAANQ